MQNIDFQGINVQRVVWRTLVVLLLSIVVMIVLLPVFKIFLVSFNGKGGLYSGYSWADYSLENWKYLFGMEYFDFRTMAHKKAEHNLLLWLFNSIKVSAITAFFSIGIASLAAYALSRFRFYFKSFLMMGVFILQIFPAIMSLVSFYLILDKIGDTFPMFGINTHGGLILVYLGGLPFHIWVLKGYFDTIPTSLEDSGRVDGLGYFRIFHKIVLPVTVPMLAVLFLIVFIMTFSDFLIPSVFLKDPEMYTFSMGMNLLVTESMAVNWGKFAAGAVFSSVPIILLFLSINKYLISGLTQGSVKG